MMMLKRIPIADLPPLDEEERDDACYRGQDRAWSALVALFDHYQRTEGLSYEKLGKRIKRSRSQVQRWLSSSYNMNLKSFGLLAEGLNADVLVDVKPRSEASFRDNYCHPREAAKAQLISIGRNQARASLVKFSSSPSDATVVAAANPSGLVVTTSQIAEHA